MLELIRRAAGSGWRTSEFWVTLAAVVLPYAAQGAEHVDGSAGVWAKVGVAAAGAAASAYYSASRGKVKAATVAAAATPAASEAAHEIVTGAGASAVPDLDPRER